MRELSHIVLHEPNSLTPGERELIATYVSSLNDCYFCQTSHGAAAASHLGESDTVKLMKTGFESVHAQMGKHLASEGYRTPSTSRTSDEFAISAPPVSHQN
jgi:AhpD family alkylhydroperoxidase